MTRIRSEGRGWEPRWIALTIRRSGDYLGPTMRMAPLLLACLPLSAWAGSLVLLQADLPEEERSQLSQALDSHLSGLDTQVQDQEGMAPAEPLELLRELGADSLVWCEHEEGRTVVHLAHAGSGQHLERELDTTGQGAAGRHASVATVVRSWVEVLALMPAEPLPAPRPPTREAWVGAGWRLRPLAGAAPLTQELAVEVGLGISGSLSASAAWLLRPGITVEQAPASLELGIHSLRLGMGWHGERGKLHPLLRLAASGTLWRHRASTEDERWESVEPASAVGAELELAGGLGIPLGSRLRLRPEVGVCVLLAGHTYEILQAEEEQSLLRPWLFQPLAGLVIEGR